MKSSKVLKIAQALFYLNAAIWLVLGITSLARMGDNTTVPRLSLLVIALLMFGNALAMFLTGVGIKWRNRWYYYFAITLLVVNIILTFTDQFGIFDLLTLILDSIILGLILISSKVFFQPA